MPKPTADEISRLHRYFAIKSNNEFWSLTEEDLAEDDKQELLTLAFLHFIIGLKLKMMKTFILPIWRWQERSVLVIARPVFSTFKKRLTTSMNKELIGFKHLQMQFIAMLHSLLGRNISHLDFMKKR